MAAEQCLAPLTEHVGNRHLVRVRSDRGAALALLGLNTLREALSQLLRHEWEHRPGSVLDATAPAQVAAERGVTTAMLVDQLRDAIDHLPAHYEQTAFASVGESQQERIRAALAGKRR